MVKRSHGALATRTKKLRVKEPVTISKLVKSFEIGNKVIIHPRAYQRGVPALRYINKQGIIIEKRGECYVVEIKDMNKTKYLVSHPVHLQLS
ncbi:MAG: 50S ribosomal protein L21e [Candidatus Micrarchaeota archaeon]|nr:50S ribosomal protein L21e [Candidatus Micrarchaeota archaeon]